MARLFQQPRNQQEGAEPGAQALIKDGRLTGTIKEYNSQGKCISSADFALQKTFRVSSTLGMEPPPGAIVLFDGKNFDRWEHAGLFTGLILVLPSLLVVSITL